MIPAGSIVAILGGQRLFELWLSRRNLRLALAEGGRERFPERFWPIALMHGLFLPALWLESRRRPVRLDGVQLALLASLLSLELCRLSCIASLGRRWNVRIVTVPGSPLVRRGPYRWLRHPNYLIVSLEFLLIPLLLGAPRSLAIFFPANLWLLRGRIKLEERALAEAAAQPA